MKKTKDFLESEYEEKYEDICEKIVPENDCPEDAYSDGFNIDDYTSELATSDKELGGIGQDAILEENEELNAFKNSESYEELDDLEELADEEDKEDEIKELEKPKKSSSKKNKREFAVSADKEERREIFVKIMEDYHSGDPVKKNNAELRAIEELEGFIYSIIKKSYATYTKLYFYDLVQEGKVGVLVGLEKYDPKQSMPTTFFFPYIKHEMQLLITRLVDRTSTHYSSNIKKINKVIEEFEASGTSYTNVDIAIQTNMTLETIAQSMAIRNYRDEVHIDGCQPGVIDEHQTSNRSLTPEQEYIEAEEKDIINQAIDKCLSPMEIKVLELHFGIHDHETMSETEIAKKLEIPKDKVKKLLNSSIKKLRDSNLKSMYKDYMAKEKDIVDGSDISFVPIEMAKREAKAFEDYDIDF